MAVNCNGTTSKAVFTGAAGGIISGYPFTIAHWVRATAGYGTGATVLLEALAADTGNGANSVMGGIITTANSRAYSTLIGGSSVNAFGAIPTVGTWQCMMVCHISATLRKIYYGGNAVVQDTGNFPAGTMTGYKSVSIGYRNIASDLPVKADLACVGIWNVELDATDYGVLNGGAVPSTVKSANLVEYWSLLNAGALTGLNGRVLIGTALTDSMVVSGSPAHPITESGPASDLAGNVNLDAAIAAGTLGSSASDLSGGIVLDNALAAGSMGSSSGTVVIPALKNWNGNPHLSVNVPLVTFLRLSDAMQTLVLTNQATDGVSGDMTIANPAISPGVAYMVIGWNADGSMRFARPVTAS